VEECAAIFPLPNQHLQDRIATQETP
jgi:hypothetical protein